MHLDTPITPGRVDWTGENPGILLKDDKDDFSAMALFFRVSWSPAGQGQLLLLYSDLQSDHGTASRPNVLIGDNPQLADFLMKNFIGKLGAFRDARPYDHLKYQPAFNIRSSGDPTSHRYTESISASELMIELVWEDLEQPRMLELVPEQTGTKEHFMTTLLVPAKTAQIIVNGQALAGKIGSRVQAGMETTTAFLYFGETWIIPEE